MLKQKIQKGEFGYLSSAGKGAVIRTILFFGISLLIFVTGYFYHGREPKNVLTVVAVLGCLPACKSLVNTIILFRAKGCSEELYKEIQGVDGTDPGYYDFYFTTYEKNYQVSHMVCYENLICGVTETLKCDCKACEEHLTSMLKTEGIWGVTVKIYESPQTYLEGLRNLSQREGQEKMDSAKEQQAVTMLMSISL